MMKIKELRELAKYADSLLWSQHGVKRMQQRGISEDDIISCIMSGEIIEFYPEDFPYPSCLIFGFSTNQTPLHVVIGVNDGVLSMVTTYYPDNIKFEDDLKTRRGNDV